MAGLSPGYAALIKQYSGNQPASGAASAAGTGGVSASGPAATQNWFSRVTPASGQEAFVLATQGPEAVEAQRKAQQKAADEEAFQTELGREGQRMAQANFYNAQGAQQAATAAGATAGGTYGSGAAASASGAAGGLDANQIKQLIDTLGLNLGGQQGTLPSTPITSPARIAPYQAPSGTAADAATWARSKDVVGRQTAAALESLKGLQAARGFGAESGVYANEEQQLLAEGLRQLSETTRQQTEDQLAREREVASEIYQGNIAQRGQDIGILGTQASTAVQNQNQALQLQLAQLGLLPSFLALLKQAY